MSSSAWPCALSNSVSAAEVRTAHGEQDLISAHRGEPPPVTVADRVPREGQGPLVLLLIRQRSLSPSPLVDRRSDAPDRDDRLVRPTAAGRRGHSPAPDAVLAQRDRITRGVPRAAGRADTRARSTAARARPHRLPAHRRPQLLRRPLGAHGAVEQGARVRRAADGSHASSPIPRTCSSCATTRSASALEELRLHWSSGGAGVPGAPPIGRPIVARRKTIYAGATPLGPAPGPRRAPAAVTEPVTIMHWGITTERVQEWLQSAASH